MLIRKEVVDNTIKKSEGVIQSFDVYSTLVESFLNNNIIFPQFGINCYFSTSITILFNFTVI